MAWPFVGVESVLYHKRRWMGVYLFTLSVAIAGVVFAIVNAYENRPVIRQYISVQEAIDRGGSLGDKYQCRCTERTPSEFSAIKACALEEGCDVSSLYDLGNGRNSSSPSSFVRMGQYTSYDPEIDYNWCLFNSSNKSKAWQTVCSQAFYKFKNTLDGDFAIQTSKVVSKDEIEQILSQLIQTAVFDAWNAASDNIGKLFMYGITDSIRVGGLNGNITKAIAAIANIESELLVDYVAQISDIVKHMKINTVVKFSTYLNHCQPMDCYVLDREPISAAYVLTVLVLAFTTWKTIFSVFEGVIIAIEKRKKQQLHDLNKNPATAGQLTDFDRQFLKFNSPADEAIMEGRNKVTPKTEEKIEMTVVPVTTKSGGQTEEYSPAYVSSSIGTTFHIASPV